MSGIQAGDSKGSQAPSKPQGALESKETRPSWHFDTLLKPPVGEVTDYTLISAGSYDTQKVLESYQHKPVPGYDVRSVKVIYNSELNRLFDGKLRLLQKREGSPAFAPKWSSESKSDSERNWRKSVLKRLEKQAAPYVDKRYPAVKILPLWHGTKPSVLTSIFETGYANLATTDFGYFGKGLYSAYEAEYAYRVYSKGALLMNWVACFSAYPLIHGDSAKVEGGANYQNYDAHFIPVVPQFSDDPSPESYIPCRTAQEAAHYHEMVVFDAGQCLPRYLVELQPSLPKTPSGQESSGALAPDKQVTFPPSASLAQLLAKQHQHHPVFQSASQETKGDSKGDSKKLDEAKKVSPAVFETNVERLKKLAVEGNGDAQLRLGLAYLFGMGTSKNLQEAQHWLEAASQHGDTPAGITAQGLCYREGLGKKKEAKKAFECFQKAAHQHYAPAQSSLGRCYLTGTGVAKDEREAVKWYRLAAEQGHARAQFNLGWSYEKGRGIAKDEREAVKWYRLAAEQGHATAQWSLGWCYESGIGVAKDEREAVKWYRLAAEQGHATVQCGLGWRYKNGIRVAKDEREAVKWYRLAAEQGHATAQWSLGWCYESGIGVAKDEREAVRLYRLSAEQGYARAQYGLGLCYRKGIGVAKDEQEAVKLYRLAAEQGDANAQYGLGLCYRKGRGVAKDINEARRYYEMAAKQGNEAAKKALASLTSSSPASGYSMSFGT